jgi:protocatechuate 3,4-dioxygenase beta subunit
MTTRRTVLTYLPLAALAGILPVRAAEEPQGPPPEYFKKHTAPEGASFFLSQVPKSERGDRMVIRGVVMDAEKKPIKNASVYIYHTDKDGLYDPQEPRPGEGSDNPRLHGYLRTDAVGRYVYGSIRPAPYPNTPLPAHVHYVVTAEGFKDRAFEFWFEGDPMITADHLAARAKRPNHFYIRPATRDSNRVWQITFDIVMERT